MALWAVTDGMFSRQCMFRVWHSIRLMISRFVGGIRAWCASISILPPFVCVSFSVDLFYSFLLVYLLVCARPFRVIHLRLHAPKKPSHLHDSSHITTTTTTTAAAAAATVTATNKSNLHHDHSHTTATTKSKSLSSLPYAPTCQPTSTMTTTPTSSSPAICIPV